MSVALTAATTIDGLAPGLVVLIELAIFAFYLLCLVMILRKAGYSGWWVLVNLIPIVGNVAFLAYLAFVPWPGQSTSSTFVPRQRYSHRTSQSVADYSTFGPGGTPPGPSYGTAGPSASGLYSQASLAALPPLAAPSAPVVVTADGQVTPTRPDTTAPVVTHPAGWYPSQEHAGYERYWDGAAWSNQFRPAQGTTT
jgi:hypothetical protein